MPDDTESEFSRNAFKKVLAGQTTKSISADSAVLLREESEEYGEKVAERAIEIAENDGRKTVRIRDVRNAVRDVKGR